MALPLSDLHAVFMEGAERAARYWTAFFRDRPTDPVEWERFGGHALVTLDRCVEFGRMPELAVDLAAALHTHMTWQGSWHEWEAVLSHMAATTYAALDAQRQWNLNAGLSAFYSRLHRLEESIALAQRNYELAVAWGDLRRQYDAFILQAEAYLNAEAWDQALRCAEDALTLSDAIGGPILQADALIDSARALMHLGAVAEAEARLERSLTLTKQGGNINYEAKARLFQGHAAGARQDWPRALTYFSEALALVQSCGDEVGRGVVLGNLGRALLELGRWDEASEALEEALRIHRFHGNAPAEMVARARLAELHARRAGATSALPS